MTKGPTTTKANTHSHCGSHGEPPPRSPFKELVTQLVTCYKKGSHQPPAVTSSCREAHAQDDSFSGAGPIRRLSGVRYKVWGSSALMGDTWEENVFSAIPCRLAKDLSGLHHNLNFFLWPVLLCPPSFHKHWTVITPISFCFSVTQPAIHHNTWPQDKIQAFRLLLLMWTQPHLNSPAFVLTRLNCEQKALTRSFCTSVLSPIDM